MQATKKFSWRRGVSGCLSLLLIPLMLPSAGVFNGLKAAAEEVEPVVFQIGDAESTGLSMSNTVISEEKCHGGSASYKMAPEAGTTGSLWKDYSVPVDLSGAYSLSDLAVSFWLYTDTSESDVSFRVDLASGETGYDSHAVSWAGLLKRTLAPQAGVWTRVTLRFSEAVISDFDWTSLRRLRFMQQGGGEKPAYTLYLDDIAIIAVNKEESGLTEGAEILLLSNADSAPVSMFNATVSSEKSHSGGNSYRLAPGRGEGASLWKDFPAPVDLSSEAYETKNLAVSFWVYTDAIADGAQFRFDLASGDNAFNGGLQSWTYLSMGELVQEAGKWTQVVLNFSDGMPNGFDWTDFRRFRFQQQSTDGAPAYTLYVDDLQIVYTQKAVEHGASEDAVFVFGNAEQRGVSMQGAAVSDKTAHNGGHSYRMAHEAGGTPPTLWRTFSPAVDLSFGGQYRPEDLGIAFWVYAENVGEPGQYFVDLSSGSWNDVLRFANIYTTELTPEAGIWKRVILRFEDGNNLGFDYTQFKQMRILQHDYSKYGEDPAYEFYIDDIEIVALPPQSDKDKLDYPVLHTFHECDDSFETGMAYANKSMFHQYTGPSSIYMAGDEEKRAALWHDLNAPVNLSSGYYDRDDLAVAFWLYAEDLGADCDMEFALFSGQKTQGNTLTMTFRKSDFIRETNKWIPVVLRLADGVDRNFDWTRQSSFHLKVLDAEGRYAFFVDHIELVSLTAFEAPEYTALQVSDQNTRIGETRRISYTVTNRLRDEPLTGWSVRLEYSPLQFEAEGPSVQPLPALAPGESATVTFTLKATEGGTGNLLLRLVTDDGAYARVETIRYSTDGYGDYWGDIHNHSTESDGSGTLTENFTAAYDRGASFNITADHDADFSHRLDLDAAMAELEKLYGGLNGFLTIKGSEITSGAHMLAYNADKVYPHAQTAEEYQAIIDDANKSGALTFLAHPFYSPFLYPGLQEAPARIDVLTGFTGLEIANGGPGFGTRTATTPTITTMALEFWDRMNIKGEKKYFGSGGSDAHRSSGITRTTTHVLIDSLTEEAVLSAMGAGRFYVSDGPTMRFTVNGATFGEDAGVAADDTTVTLRVMGASTEELGGIDGIRLYKYSINAQDNEAAYRAGECISLYQADGEPGYFVDITRKIQVSPGDFLRVEVYTDGYYQGTAFSNPIWIVKADASETVKVDFDSQGGTPVDGQVIIRGETAVKPKNPLREGYAFAGWCPATDDEELFDFRTPIVSDMTLYARWVKKGTSPQTGDTAAPASGLAGASIASLTLLIRRWKKRRAPADR